MRRIVPIAKVVFIILLLALSFLLLSPNSSCEEVKLLNVRDLSLKEAIAIAFLNNRAVQVQEQEVDFAKANIMDATSRFLPVLSTGYTYTYNGSVFYGDSLPNTRKDTRIFSGYKSDNQLDFSVYENIFSGQNIANFKQSKLQYKAQLETLRQTKLDIEFETKGLYYGLLLAYETERIAMDLLNQSKAHYDNVKQKFDQGTASKFDVLQSSVQVSKVYPQVVNAKNEVEYITAELKKILSIDLAQEIRVTEHLGYSLIPIKEDEYLKQAYEGNPVIVLKVLGIDITKWGIEYARSGWYPEVDAMANYVYRSNDLGDMMNPRHDNWNIGVKASINIFDGFSTKAKVDEARSRYNQASIQKEDFVEQLAVDVKKACLDLGQASAIIKSQEDSIVEAKEALKISEIGYDNGVVDNLNVLDSQVSLSQVETNLAQAIYDYVMAKAQLDRLRGILYMEVKR